MITTICPVGLTGTVTLRLFSFKTAWKRQFLLVLFVFVIKTVLVSCSGKGDPGPDPNVNPDPGTNPGSTNPIDYDPAFPFHEGKADFSSMSPDGKVVIWGSSKNITTPIFRLTKDGQHDTSFNIDADKSWIIRKASDMAVQPDGKVILAGEFVVNGKGCSIIRLTGSGMLDNSFTPYDITKLTTYDITIANLLVQSDGKIVFSQSMFNSSLGIRFNSIFRLLENGMKESSFNIEGAWIKSPTNDTRIIGSNVITDIIQLPDGKLLACGGVKFFDKRRYVARINTNGSLDESFEFKELVTSANSITDDLLCIAEQNGKILVGGNFSALVSDTQRDTQYAFLNLMRLNSDGSIDQTFGKNTVKAFPIALVVRNDKSFIALTKPVSSDTHISLHTDNGVIREAYSLADAKSSFKNLFRQSDSSLLVTGNILSGSQSYAVARLVLK
jgi:uncharacterized delta-60 repeat protein